MIETKSQMMSIRCPGDAYTVLAGKDAAKDDQTLAYLGAAALGVLVATSVSKANSGLSKILCPTATFLAP